MQLLSKLLNNHAGENHPLAGLMVAMAPYRPILYKIVFSVGHERLGITSGTFSGHLWNTFETLGARFCRSWTLPKNA